MCVSGSLWGTEHRCGGPVSLGFEWHKGNQKLVAKNWAYAISPCYINQIIFLQYLPSDYRYRHTSSDVA